MKKVLAIDDSPVLRMIYKSALKNDFHIDLVGDGEEGLKKAFSDQYDLILTDYNLPGMTGLNIIDMLRSKSKYVQTPIIIITTDVDSIKKSRKAGASAFLIKPISPKKLLLAAKLLTGE